MWHYFYQSGHIIGIPGIFGAGTAVETDDACTRVLQVRPLFEQPSLAQEEPQVKLKEEEKRAHRS